MKTLTDTERVAILKRARENVDWGYSIGICGAITMSKGFDNRFDVFDCFPELLKYKPQNRLLRSYWYEYGQRKKRLSILDKVIDEIQNKTGGKIK